MKTLIDAINPEIEQIARYCMREGKKELAESFLICLREIKNKIDNKEFVLAFIEMLERLCEQYQ